MFRKENKLSSRLAVRSTIPYTSTPPKKDIKKPMSFDTGFNKSNIGVIHGRQVIQILPLPVTSTPSWRNITSEEDTSSRNTRSFQP